MSFIKNSIKSSSERGFTIVELLIVIVVIGILAAITIVSFNGVTARANATSAKAAASAAIKKAEAYNARENSTGYPTAPAQLTGAATTEAYNLTGVTFNTAGTSGTAPAATAPGSPSTINFFNCPTASGGARFDYWDYSNATPQWTSMFTGGATLATCANTTYVKG